MKNYYEQMRNKTAVYADSQAVMIDTDKLQLLTDREDVDEVIIKNGNKVYVTFKSGGIKPLFAYLFRTKKGQNVEHLNGNYDVRHQHMKII